MASGDVQHARNIAGKILAAAVYAVTFLLALYVTRIYLDYPQADDAFVRADTLGIAPHISGYVTPRIPRCPQAYWLESNRLNTIFSKSPESSKRLRSPEVISNLPVAVPLVRSGSATAAVTLLAAGSIHSRIESPGRAGQPRRAR